MSLAYAEKKKKKRKISKIISQCVPIENSFLLEGLTKFLFCILKVCFPRILYLCFQEQELKIFLLRSIIPKQKKELS